MSSLLTYLLTYFLPSMFCWLFGWDFFSRCLVRPTNGVADVLLLLDVVDKKGSEGGRQSGTPRHDVLFFSSLWYGSDVVQCGIERCLPPFTASAQNGNDTAALWRLRLDCHHSNTHARTHTGSVLTAGPRYRSVQTVWPYRTLQI